jgi:hypothetical protein
MAKKGGDWMDCLIISKKNCGKNIGYKKFLSFFGVKNASVIDTLKRIDLRIN